MGDGGWMGDRGWGICGGGRLCTVVEEGRGAEIERGDFFGGADFSLFFLDFCEVEALVGGMFWNM